MNNENEDLENIKIVEGVKNTMGENQYFGEMKVIKNIYKNKKII